MSKVDNPFSVVSPEELSAEEAYQLFVEVSDYEEIRRQGNTLITGARGCGKSMLIRCCLPDFLMCRNHCAFSELPFLSFNISIKKTSLNLVELRNLDGLHMPYLINEHFMTLNVMISAFHILSNVQFEIEKYNIEDYKKFYSMYVKYLSLSGCNDEIVVDYSSPNSFFQSLFSHLVDLSYNFIPYISGLFQAEINDFSYNYPLFSFSRILVPVFSQLRELTCFPKGKPILLLFDDADNLSDTQTKILNSWIANRTQPTISLKIFTQFKMYKTFLTPTNNLIESPHDYQELDISSKYTTKNTAYGSTNQYYEKVISILFRRLKRAGYFPKISDENKDETEKALKSFFPTYDKQEEGIKKEEDRIKEEYEQNGRGYRLNDDIRRYAIPNYIRHLAGKSKNKPLYKYAGLETIIHLSSGIIRYLLDAVAKMYDATSGAKGNEFIPEIPYGIQDAILRERADFYLFTELPKAYELYGKTQKDISDFNILTSSNPQSASELLANLINSMGKTFQEILLSGKDEDPFSGRSERKVFSIAISNPEKKDRVVEMVLNLGVRLGFLHESFIGNKNGDGRTRLYILNRCFAPVFTLDPSGFQGYLFMTVEDLGKAIQNGKGLRNIDSGYDPLEAKQLSIDDFLEG